MTAIAQRLPSLAQVRGKLGLNLDPFRLMLSLLIIISVSRIHQHFRPIALMRPALLLAFGAAAYAYLNPKKVSLKGILGTTPARLVLAMFVLACISAPFGLSLGNSGRFILESYSKVIVGALLFIAAIRNVRDLYTFVWAYVIACAILAWLSIFVFGLYRPEGGFNVRLEGLYRYDANDVGVVLLVGLGMVLLLIQVASPWGRVLAFTTLIGIGITLARSGSRGAFVGMIAVGIGLLLLLRKVALWKRVAAIVVTTVALVLSAPPGYWEQMRTLLKPKEDYNWTSETGRKEVTKRGISYMLGRPLTGLGINNFWRAECLETEFARVQNRLGGHGIRCTAPHNSYIEAGAELGVTGLIIWLWLVWGTIGRMLRIRRRLPEAWVRGTQEERFLFHAPQYLAVSMLGFAVTSFFVSFAWLDIVYTLIAFMVGLLVVIDRRVPQAAVQPAAPVRAPRSRVIPGFRSLRTPAR